MKPKTFPFLAAVLFTAHATLPRLQADSLVAVTLSNGDIDEYYVSKGTFNANATWSKVRTIANLPSVHGIAYNPADGNFYTTVAAGTRKISKLTRAGVETVLATRGIGTPAWTAADPNGIQMGPDGKIYFTTAFGGGANTNGVFRLNTDGTGFAQFIAPTAAALGRSRDLLWDGSFLYVAARDANAVHKFDSAGAFVSTLTTAATGASFIGRDGTTLMIGTTAAAGPNALRKIDDFATVPVLGSLTATGKTNAFALEVIEGQRHYVTFNGGTGGAGDINRLNLDGSSTVIATFNLPTVRTANDFVVYPTVDTDGDGLPDAWEMAKLGTLAQGAADNISDTDTLTNIQEYTFGTNPAATDTDSDGASDSAEANRLVSGSPAPTNPTLADTDGDGLPDGAETHTGTLVSAADSGTNPLAADTDGDTFNDYIEIARSSDPFLNTSTPGSTAVNPIVSLSATGLAAGPLAAWTNNGTIGSSFLPGAAQPTVATLQGVKGVIFTGSEVLTGVAAPPVLTGNSSRTVTAWVYNPAAALDEAIVGWGRRDGPNNTNAVFGHGTSPTFGAVGNWGADADMGWGSSSNVKTGRWTYLAYTYDSATRVGTVYVDGAQVNQETFAAVLNTWGVDNTPFARPLPFRVGGTNAADGSLSTVSGNASLTLGNLKIYDHVSTGDELGFSDSELPTPDGVPDWYEVFYGLNPATNDSGLDPDGDTLSNFDEFTFGTNPIATDTDSDGLRDDYESDFGFYTSPTNTGTSPVRADSDGDGLLDGVETATGTFVSPSNTGSNPNDPDTDSDTVNDGLEVLTYGTNPNVDGDKDGDTLSDAAEINIHLTNPSLVDTDGDTFNDNVEVDAGSGPNDPISTPNNIAGYSGNLVHRYPLDETAGTVAADSAGVVNGTVGSEVLLGQAGRDGRSYRFPAAATANSKVNLPNIIVPAAGAPFTMAAWVKLAAALPNGGQSHFISGNDGAFANRWNLGVNDNDATAAVDARLFWFQEGALGAVSVAGYNFNDHVGEWVHVAISRSSTGLTTLFINGTGSEVGESKVALRIPPAGISFAAGPATATSQLNGNLDDVRFYDGGLSPANLLALYNSYVSLYDTWAMGYGLNPNGNGAPGADADGDGSINQVEYLLGLIPNSGSSRFAAVTTGTPATGITLTWPSQPGISFAVKSSLTLDSFTTVEAIVPAAASPATTTSWTSGVLVDPKKFFRIEFPY